MRREARSARAVLVTKANSRATVHRGSYLDYVGVRTFDARGRVTGEHRFLGLWTSSAYESSPRTIPLLKDKINAVVGAFNAPPGSHDAKALAHVLETYPRDELFQASIAELVRNVRGIVNLYERAQVRLFARRDPFGRFYSCLVYVPRDRYDSAGTRAHRSAAARANSAARPWNRRSRSQNPLWHACMSWCVWEPPRRRGWTWRRSSAPWRARPRPGRRGCAMP